MQIYFGKSSYCFCGNYYGRTGQAAGSLMTCSGNASQFCGGYGIFSTYSTHLTKQVKTVNTSKKNQQWI